MYEYKMTEIAPSISGRFGKTQGEAAKHLQSVVTEQTQGGWEFFRVDEFTIVERGGCGCLSIFGFGATETYTLYVVTFRRFLSPAEGGDVPV